MKGWRECKLSDAVNFGNGKVRPNSDGTIPVYGGNGILGFGNESNYKDETIVIGRVGAYCGAVYFENKPIWVSDNALSAKPTDISDAKFIFYYLKNLGLNQFAEGSSHPLVTQTLLNSIDIIIPSTLPEQKAIAAVLSSLDDKIDLLHRQNKTLEAMAETLFRQWFVEEADEGWEEGKLGDLMILSNGKSRPNTVGLIPVYGGNGVLSYTDRSNYEGESIIIGRVGAYCGSIFFENNEIWVSDNALHAKAKSSEENYFLFYLLRILGLNSLAEGSSHPLLTQTLLNSIDIIIPDRGKRIEFNIIVKHFHSKIFANNSNIKLLESLRDTILPKLMSGEVRVKV